jgi:hypothetical protein
VFLCLARCRETEWASRFVRHGAGCSTSCDASRAYCRSACGVYITCKSDPWVDVDDVERIVDTRAGCVSLACGVVQDVYGFRAADPRTVLSEGEPLPAVVHGCLRLPACMLLVSQPFPLVHYHAAKITYPTFPTGPWSADHFQRLSSSLLVQSASYIPPSFYMTVGVPLNSRDNPLVYYCTKEAAYLPNLTRHVIDRRHCYLVLLKNTINQSTHLHCIGDFIASL